MKNQLKGPATRNSEVLIQTKFLLSLTCVFLLPQAACKIAGRNINVAVIQSMVLGCNTHCPGQVRRKCT